MMNQNRRTLLKTLAGFAASTTLSPLSAITLDDNVYRNSRLGLSLKKPEHWHFVSVTDFERAMDRQEETFSDATKLAEIRELGTPILILAKYPLDHDGFIPLVEVHAGPPELDPFDSYEELCIEAATGVSHLHSNYVVEEETSFVDLCGFKAAEFQATLQFESEGKIWPTRMRNLLVHTKSTEFCINFMGTVSGAESAVGDLKAIRDSIRVW